MPVRISIAASSAVLFLCVCSVSVATAEDDRDSDDVQIIQELFLGEVPYPQERGEVQTTLRGTHFAGDEADTVEVSLDVEYGITERLQIGAKIPYVRRDPNDEDEERSDGIGDIEIGILYAIVNEEVVVVSGALDVGLPTGDEDEELGEGKVEWEPSLRAGVAVGESWLFGTLGAELSNDGESALTYGAAFAYRLSDVAVGVVELNGATGGEEEVLFLVPGMVWQPFSLELQVGVPVGLTNDAADWGLVAAIILEF